MLTISSALIIRNKKIFLQKRAKTVSRFPGFWGFPGGKNDLGETPEIACVREVKEEINLDFQILSLFHHNSDDSGQVYSYLGKESGVINLQEEDVEKAEFFSYSEAIELPLAFSYTKIVLEKLKNEHLID